MNENKLNQPEKQINVDLITSAESIKNIVKRDRYLLLSPYNLQGREDIDIDALSKELKSEGFMIHHELEDYIFYDPNRFEVKDVNVYKGLDEKHTEEGWKEVSRTGEWATLIKEK